MSHLFHSLKGTKSNRDDLNPTAPYSSEPPAYSAPSSDNPPPYHNWESVPDTALLPPPPSLPNDYSTTSNASYDSAAKAHEWCSRFPVYQPMVPSAALVDLVKMGKLGINLPSSDFRGDLKLIESHASTNGERPVRVYRLRTGSTSKGIFSSRSNDPIPVDQIFLSDLPLYFAALNHPFSEHFGAEKSEPFSIYFEIRPLSFNSKDSTVAIGFASTPYPPWRQPGWQRASIGVHSDDGRRFSNDPWGGVDFVEPFKVGDILGLAMVFYPQQISPGDSKSTTTSSTKTSAAFQVQTGISPVKTRAYFTRNGRVEGSWDMDEERDAEKDEGIEGLQGEADLNAAVGTFGDVDIEIRFFSQSCGFVPPP